MVDESPIERLKNLRLHQANGRRSPHKPLLVLLALGNLVRRGHSDVEWSQAELKLVELLAEYGPSRRKPGAQSAAYPFTHLRSDGVWHLDRDVPMDKIKPLRAGPITGRLDTALERKLRGDPHTLAVVARMLVDAHFPDTVARDLLVDVGLDPDFVYGTDESTAPFPESRRRCASWRSSVLEAWDRQCAFCGFDGLLAGASVGVEAAHVRWFNHDGPDEPDNGLALCSLHHKLLDRGVLGLDDNKTVQVSGVYTARTEAGRSVYDLHGRPLHPRPGTWLPADCHVRWHRSEVFKGKPLAA